VYKQGYTTYVEENVTITTGVVSTKNITLVAGV